MNKKGLSTLGILGLFFVVLTLTFIISVQKGGISKEKILEKNWYKMSNFHNETLEIQKTDGNTISKIVYSYVDFIGYASFESAKAATSFGLEYKLNGLTILRVITLILILWLSVYLIKIGALFFIIIKEIILWYKNKIEIKKLKEVK